MSNSSGSLAHAGANSITEMRTFSMEDEARIRILEAAVQSENCGIIWGVQWICPSGISCGISFKKNVIEVKFLGTATEWHGRRRPDAKLNDPTELPLLGSRIGGFVRIDQRTTAGCHPCNQRQSLPRRIRNVTLPTPTEIVGPATTLSRITRCL